MDSYTNEAITERLARLETENEQCSRERISHESRIDELMNTLNYVRGGMKMLVVLWAIATGAIGIGAAKLLVH